MHQFTHSPAAFENLCHPTATSTLGNVKHLNWGFDLSIALWLVLFEFSSKGWSPGTHLSPLIQHHSHFSRLCQSGSQKPSPWHWGGGAGWLPRSALWRPGGWHLLIIKTTHFPPSTGLMLPDKDLNTCPGNKGRVKIYSQGKQVWEASEWKGLKFSKPVRWHFLSVSLALFSSYP